MEGAEQPPEGELHRSLSNQRDSEEDASDWVGVRLGRILLFSGRGCSMGNAESRDWGRTCGREDRTEAGGTERRPLLYFNRRGERMGCV